MTEQVEHEEHDFPPVTPQFAGIVREAMKSREQWQFFVRPENIRRTEAALRWLIRSLDNQIKVHSDPGDPQFNADWLRRTRSLRRIVDERLTQTQSIIESHNGGFTLAQYKRLVEDLVLYKEFCWDLAVELEKCGKKGLDALHDIQAPRGGISAFEWLERRTKVIEEQERRDSQ